MSRFLAGLIIGLILGGAASAYAAGCFGEGTAHGWTVTKDGDEVCSGPQIDNVQKEIQCD
jgi:hypothetical protein